MPRHAGEGIFHESLHGRMVGTRPLLGGWMIRFGNLKAADFGPLGSVELPLDARGLLLIRGDNRDTAAADSNGAGKSHVFKALTWALYGDTVEGDRHDQVIRIGAPACAVKVDWQDEAGWWSVLRSKARGSAAELKLYHGSEDISAKTIADTQAEIVRRLGLDFATWRNTVLYGQGDLVRFADPATTDTERKAILKRILRLEVLDRALELSRARAKALELDRSCLEREISDAEAELRGLGDAASLRSGIEAAMAEAQEHEKKAAKLPRLRKILGQIEEHLAELDKIREKTASHHHHIAELRGVIGREEASASAHNREASKTLDQVKLLESGTCPTCGSPSTSTSVKKKLAGLRASAKASVQAADQAKALAQASTIIITEVKYEIDQLANEMAETANWRSKQAEISGEVRWAERAGTLAASCRSRAITLQAELAKHEARISGLKERWSFANNERAKLEEKLRELGFWGKGFSNAGLPSYLMDAVVPELTERANHYLGILADGDIRVGFDTQIKLKSGEAREKLAINWTIEGQAGATPSGGQRKKISIAVDLALMDLVAVRERAAIDLLMMDEVLDGLDATGKSRVMDLLAELRQRRSSILVVSHDPGLSELFESVITVTKEGGVSRLEALT